MIGKKWSLSAYHVVNLILILVRCETALQGEYLKGSSTGKCLQLQRTESLIGSGQINYECGKERNEKQQSLRIGFCVTEYKVFISDFITEKGMINDRTPSSHLEKEMFQVIISQTLPLEPPPFLPHMKQRTG